MHRWLVYSVVAIVIWGGWGLIGKETKLDPLLMTALSTIGVVGVAVFLLFSPGLKTGKNHGRGMVMAFVTGIFGNFGNLAYLKALKVGDASLVAPFTALYPAVTVALAFVLLRDRMNLVQWTGFALALAAVGLYSYIGSDPAKQGFVVGEWMLWASGTAVCFGIAAVTQKIATNHISNELSLVCFAASYVPVGAAILLLRGPFDWNFPRFEWVWALLYGAGISIGTLVLFAAYRWGNTSVVTALTGLYPVLTAILALSLPRYDEKYTTLKGVAILLAAAAGTALTWEKKKADAGA